MAPRSLLLALAIPLGLLAAPARAAERPNVVLIVLDDVGYGDLGAYGGAFVQTPVLDALAREGARFTQYHSNAPLCTPSRAAILTGQHPIHLGMRAALDDASERGLPPGVETIADRLRSAGYATGHFGKWHLGRRPEHLPTRHGFDHSMIPGIPVVANDVYLDRAISIDDGPPVTAVGHLTEVTTDRAIEFIRENAGRPFFANVWYNAAHRPYQPPPRWMERYPDTDAGLYAATLSHADEQIGRILEALRSLGLESGTLVLVTSDNGSLHPEIASNGDLRGTKGDVFEGGLRLPLIARWPGRIEAGRTNDSLFLGIDFLPTIAELAGVAVGLELPGRSLLPALLAGETMAREEPVSWEAADKPLSNDLATSPVAYAVRQGPWKLVRSLATGSDRPALFDLTSDEGEATDLAPAHPELVAELERSYRLWRAREARIETTVAQRSGATAIGSWMSFSGGLVELAPDARFRLDYGDFGFQVRVTPAELDAPQVVASQPGSWTLTLQRDGSVQLAVPREADSRAPLASPPRLRPGVAADLAFSIFGTRNWIDLHLFVDGRLEAAARLQGAMQASDASVRIGNGSAGARPLRGVLWAPRFYLASLGPEDLLDLDFDGLPNAEDDCIDAANGPDRPEPGGRVQRDEDGDGIGSACDPDFNGDGVVGAPDFLALYQRFGLRPIGSGPAARFDLDGSGAVSFRDLAILGSYLGRPPGPSGLLCTPAAPCAVSAAP